MQTLARAVSRPGAGGAPLPTIYPSLARDWKMDIRRGEVTLIAAQPGAGKSTLALDMCVKWVTQHDLIGLYFSADSSELVAASRAGAMLTGYTTQDVESRLKRGDGYIIDILEQLAGLRFCFEPDITLEVLELEVEAFVELWGREPDFIVVDNLTDVEGQAEDEFPALRRTMKVMTYLARESGAGVLVLHHTSEGENPDPCPSRKSIHGKVAQKAAVIVTMAEGWNEKHIAVVKNRFGKSDRTGRTATAIKFDPERMAFMDKAAVEAA